MVLDEAALLVVLDSLILEYPLVLVNPLLLELGRGIVALSVAVSVIVHPQVPLEGQAVVVVNFEPISHVMEVALELERSSA